LSFQKIAGGRTRIMNDPVTTPSARFPASRLLLIGAGVIALVAVGVAVAKRGTDAPTPAPATADAATQPDIDTMIAGLEAKLKENPGDAAGWRMLGWSFFETGRFAEAATAYRRAATLEPDNADYWSSLGESLVLAGSGDIPPDAAKAVATALEKDPKDPRARYFSGVARDMGGDSKGALDDWLALLKDTPAGAPWEADLRRTIEQVAAREKIDIAARLAAISPAPAAPSVATAAIPGPTREQMAAASQLPPGQQQAMIQGMVEGLASKLAADPKNADGWIMLMRSRMQLGQSREAAAALASARAAFAGDRTQLGRFSEAAAQLGIPGG
jgi:cytochrome c-type biogenesis protein CcmH